eukprot:COSAG06_NODE_44959_length_358_cov_28.471042_1_plen_70_part_01
MANALAMHDERRGVEGEPRAGLAGGALTHGWSWALNRWCVRRAQEARLQSLAMQLAESDCTLRVTNTHLC